MAQRWLILGASGHARSVCDAIAASGDHVVGFLDTALAPCTLLNGTPVLGGLSFAWDLDRLFESSDEAPADQVVVAIGIRPSVKLGSRCLCRWPLPLGWCCIPEQS